MVKDQGLTDTVDDELTVAMATIEIRKRTNEDDVIEGAEKLTKACERLGEIFNELRKSTIKLATRMEQVENFR